MAARLTKRLADQTKDAIQTSMLIKRLQNHTVDECMSATQIRAAEILLNKTVPNLKSIEISGDPDKPLLTKIEVEVVDPKN